MNELWNEPDTAEVIRLWNEGYSASQIATKIPGARSRNAVIGRVHRLRAAGQVFTRPPSTPQERTYAAVQARKRQTNVTRPTGPRRTRPQRQHNNLAAVNVHRRRTGPRPPAQRLEVAMIEVTHAKPWLERKFGECAYPVSGEGADTLSCCNRTAAIYCEGHAALMFVQPQEPAARLIKWGVRFAA